MRILRTTVLSVAAVWAAGWFMAPWQIGAQTQGRTGSAHTMPMVKTAMMSKAQKIANAVTAAPEAISGKATVLDWAEGYMLAAGGGWGSNTDPYAMKATPKSVASRRTAHDDPRARSQIAHGDSD